MTECIILRHGHSTYNQKGLYTGHADAPLDTLGREQARQLALQLADTRVNAIYASDLCRAVETVRPTAERLGLDIRTDKALREIDMGAFTGLPYAEVQASFPAEYTAFCADIRTPAKGGESIASACERILAALYRILQAHEGERILVCSHALTCRLLHCLSQGRPMTQVMDSPVPPNATPVYYRFSAGSFSPL